MAIEAADTRATKRFEALNRPAIMVVAAAVLAAVLSVCVWFPGVLNNDSAQQFQNAFTGVVDDWHPPIMTRLWMAFGPSDKASSI